MGYRSDFNRETATNSIDTIFFSAYSSNLRKRGGIMMRLVLATIVVATIVDAGLIRHRIASDLPSSAEVASAFNEMKDMKLSELAKVLSSSEAVRSSVRRAAMDVQEHEALRHMASRLAMNPAVQQAMDGFMREGQNLFVKDLANLRQSTSEGFHSSVRSALDAMMADESSRPLATHLKQAWDADSVDEQLKHLNMALDALDAGAEPEQRDEAPMESAPIDGGFAEADEGEEEDDDEGDDVDAGAPEAADEGEDEDGFSGKDEEGEEEDNDAGAPEGEDEGEEEEDEEEDDDAGAPEGVDEGEEEEDEDEENEEEEEDDEDADAAQLAEFFEKMRKEKAAKEATEMKAAQMKEAEMKKAEMEKVNVKARKVRRHD